jgi:hypothetical protein
MTSQECSAVAQQQNVRLEFVNNNTQFGGFRVVPFETEYEEELRRSGDEKYPGRTHLGLWRGDRCLLRTDDAAELLSVIDMIRMETVRRMLAY